MTEEMVRVLNWPGLEAKLKGLADAVAEDALVRAATAGALVIQNDAKERAPKKTRNLARSIHTEVVERARHRVKLRIGTDLEYAAIHEFGGTIRPKNSKFLAIPVTAAAKAQAGGPRSFPSELRAVVNGNQGVLVDGDDVVQYVLVKSVKIPARPYLRPAVWKKADAAVQATSKALARLIEQAAKK